METNLTLHGWLQSYMKANEIPRVRRRAAAAAAARHGPAPALPGVRESAAPPWALLGFQRVPMIPDPGPPPPSRSPSPPLPQPARRQDGSWDDVSGETFLRKLLALPISEARWTLAGRDEMFECTKAIGVDPRNIAQRIMDIRWAGGRGGWAAAW